MATIAPVIPLDEHRAVRVPQAPPGATPEDACYLGVVFEMGKGDGAWGERQWWFKTLGPWAEKMWAAAHPGAAGAVS